MLAQKNSTRQIQKARRSINSKASHLSSSLPYLNQIYILLKQQERQLVRWYIRNDHKYGWRWRAANFSAIVLILASIGIPIAQELYKADSYKLSADALNLVGNSDASLSKLLTYDGQRGLYQFNKAAVTNSSLPSQVQRTSVGTPASKNSSGYALDVPQDISQGVTYHDINSQLSFGLKPQFKAMTGKNVDGHLVYPLGAGNQAIYSLKGNGLKEDIVIPRASSDTMRFSYILNLPNTLQAKVIPDSGGAIGIYSADPNLYGDISYGSDADEARIQKVRETADKTTLVFGLPAPVIKAVSGGSIGQANARFELSGNNLTVVAENLKSANSALTIDPSVVITSTSDFGIDGNNEGMIDFATAGQISRGTLTGGSIGSWSTGNASTDNKHGNRSVAYNGYLYTLGGENTTFYNQVQYATINSNGTVGAWHYTHNSTDDGVTFVAGFNTTRAFAGAVAYNGYLYVMGGASSGYTTTYNDIQYAKLNADGTVGTWSATNSFTGIRADFGVTVYNNYIYIAGGESGTADYNDVQYAPMNADGTIGTWTATTSFTYARDGFGFTINNGYLYVVGGVTSFPSTTMRSDVQYAQINADGTVGSWMTTAGLGTNRSDAAVVAYNGYLYAFGGSSTGSDRIATTQYAQISANGSIGPWTATTVLTSPRRDAGTAIYGGYVYIVSGETTSGVETNTTYYGSIDLAGRPKAWATDSTHTIGTATANVCAIAYNGYLYQIGGSTTDDGQNNVATVKYTTISASGVLGTWATTTSLPVARSSSGCTASNGYLYLIGGYTGSAAEDGAVLMNTINSNGTLNTWTNQAGGTWSTQTTSIGGASSGTYTPDRSGVFVYNSYLYSVGGLHGGASAWYAPITIATGAVGTWTLSSAAFNSNYNYSAYTRVGAYFYKIGGTAGITTVQTAVEYAPITSSGPTGTWTNTSSLPTAIGYNNGATVNGCMYSVGGKNSGGTSQSTVYYACPNADGSISASGANGWQTAPSLPTATTDAGYASYNGYIYGVGGWTTAASANVLYTSVNNGGSGQTSAWSDSSRNFTTARISHASVAYNGYLYVAGGSNISHGANYNDVQYAAINADGTLGMWASAGYSFSSARYDLGLVAYNGYLYVAGGKDVGGTYYKDIQYAPIGSSGALSAAFMTNSTSFDTTGRAGSGVFIYNNYLYVSGGYDASQDYALTRYAPVNTNGSIGSFAATTSFTNARANMGIIVANDYVYIIGGSGASKYNDVQTAVINSNGTLGSWTATTSFAGARDDFTAVIANGFVYLMGGVNSGGQTYADLQYAPINTGGTLGAWQNSVAFGSSDSASTVYYKGYLYLIGGSDGSTAQTYTKYTALDSIARAGRYSKTLDFGGTTNVTGVTYNGYLPGDSSAITYRAAGTNGVFNNSASVPAIAATGQCTGNVTNDRYLQLTFNFDENAYSSASFPDTTTSGTLTRSNLTDFTVSYNTIHPQPNIRLRLGQTLQSGNLSVFDTCL